jgi:hypothetical protein
MRLSEPEIDLSEAKVNELRALLDRVSRSLQLRRASSLRELLLCIGEQSIDKKRMDLHEQEIGCSAFGRSSNYDTGQDNIVRVNATESGRGSRTTSRWTALMKPAWPSQ